MLCPLKPQYPSNKRVGGPQSQSRHYPKATYRNILFNHTVNCQDNTSKVVNELNMRMELGSNATDKGKPHPRATFSTKNPIWCGLGLNLGICRGRPVTNHMSHGLLKTCAMNQTTILQHTTQTSTHYTMIS